MAVLSMQQFGAGFERPQQPSSSTYKIPGSDLRFSSVSAAQEYMQGARGRGTGRGQPVKPGLTKGARKSWKAALAQYAPGGGYGKGVEAGLERGRTKAVSSGMQSLVSSGLAGTTMAAGLGKKFEEEVADPARARVEETRAQAIANLQAGFAGAEQRGFETAEDRALRSQQISSQEGMADERLQFGYENLAVQRAMNKMRIEQQSQRQSNVGADGENGKKSKFVAGDGWY